MLFAISLVTAMIYCLACFANIIRRDSDTSSVKCIYFFRQFRDQNISSAETALDHGTSAGEKYAQMSQYTLTS